MLRVSMILALGLILTSCSSAKKASLPPKDKAPSGVNAAPPAQKVEGENDETRLFGQAFSLNKTLLVFQTQGFVQHIYGRVGMHFKKGDVLAELDSRDHAHRAEMAKSQYLQVMNQKKIVERNFGIAKALYEQKIDSQMAYLDSETTFNNASLSASIAETNMKIAEKALADTKLRAPYDCVVSRQIKFLGESAMGGAENGAALEVYDSRPPELVFTAPESMLGRVKVGAEMEVNVPALKLKVPAKVVRLVPVINEASRSFTVVAHLATPDSRVVAGYFVEGVFKTSRKPGKSL